jgi:rhodanese-related sulfurtransferase/DNA-binding transcriptional ArsR family regulator
MDHRIFKNSLNEEFSRIAKAIANPHRFEIVDILAQGERSVEELAQEISLSVANTSQHLQTLREAHLLVSHKVGLRVYYRLASPEVYQLIQVIRRIAEQQLAEIDRIVQSYLSERSSLESLSLEELASRLNETGLIILDVRPQLEYAQGHILGARSIPITELQNRLQELPREQEIVAYCRGEYCVFADEAVALLQAEGYEARRLREGYPDWLIAKLPIETTRSSS